jgi:DNA helicase II / ATP-dependent DNA helicase PcrA
LFTARYTEKMDLLKGLNPQQAEAVTHNEGPLLILAGAGSGKTKALTTRLAYLIKERRVHPAQILAITFTNKAAREMKSRVDRLLGVQAARGIWVMTFHASCVRILREEIENLSGRDGKGYNNKFVIYDENDSERLIKDCLLEMNLDIKRYAPKAVKFLISAAKNELVDADTFASRNSTHFEEIAGEVYKMYQQKLEKSNAVDFDDIIMLTVNVFELFPQVLLKWQERFKYIMVDEYQDTNHAQFRLISLIAKRYQNLCVVGDPDQSIYKFRGADIRNILEFERDFADAKIISLEQNYRSTQTILEAANQVIKNNRGRKEKNLWSDIEGGQPIFLYQAENERDEAIYVASEISQTVREGTREYGEFAVFYRTNAQSRVFEEVMMSFDIPYKLVGGTRFYDRMEVKDLMAYLRFIQNSRDNIAAKRIVNTPRRGIGKTSIDRVSAYANMMGISFYEGLQNVNEIPGGISAAAKIESFVTMIESFRAEADGDIVDLMRDIIEKTGYVRQLEKEGTFEAQGRVDNIGELVSAVAEFKTAHPEGKLEDFLEKVALIADVDNLPESTDAVTFMTMHNAKGLEFPVVFMSGMEEGLFPHSRSLADPAEIEEERRLCYVGLTRAREQLYLTCAWLRSLYGQPNYMMQSRFLKEIPEEFVEPVQM